MGKLTLRVSVSMFTLSVLTFLAQPSAAQGPGRGKSLDLTQGNPALRKVSTYLLKHRAGQTHVAQGGFVQTVPLKMGGDLPEIEIRLTVLTPEILGRVQQLGVQVIHASERAGRIVGTIDLDRLDELAAIPEVTFIHPNYRPLTFTGSVTSQGDASMKADQARSEFGVSGAGVKVATVSDSFNDILGGTVTGTGCSRTVTLMPNQMSGDLPSSVQLLDSGPGGGSDEGAALGENVFDVAPGSAISFHSASNGISDFADGIRELAACSADVIVDDVIYFIEPMFQDGLIAQAVDDVTMDGVAYLSAAGNSGNKGVLTQYKDSNPGSSALFGDDFHDWDDGAPDPYLEVVVPGFASLFGVLQWRDPFSGVLGPGAANDYDLCFCTVEGDPSSCTFCSADAQGCGIPAPSGGDPFEFVAITNTGATPASIFIIVDRFCGADDLDFRLVTFPLGVFIGNFAYESFVDGPTLYGHMMADYSWSVGAAFYGEIDSGGTLFGDPTRIDPEEFSAKGGGWMDPGLPVFFDPTGNPLSQPDLRRQPAFTAPDGGNNTFFGSDFEPDGFPNFFGTSASAPHAAGAAALLLEGTNLTASGVHQVMDASADDIGIPGLDDFNGPGLLNVRNARGTVHPPPTGQPFYIQELDLWGNPNDGPQHFRAGSKIMYHQGTFDDVIGHAPLHCFMNGAEIGNGSQFGGLP